MARDVKKKKKQPTAADKRKLKKLLNEKVKLAGLSPVSGMSEKELNKLLGTSWKNVSHKTSSGGGGGKGGDDLQKILSGKYRR